MSFRKKIKIYAFIVLAAVLLVWSAEVLIANDSSVNNGTLIEKPYNSTLLEKPDRMPVSAPGSRYVWAADAGANSSFILTPLNFDGFYYDLDNNAGSESFSITLANPDNRSINENNLKYSTTVSNIPFKYRPFGNYSVIGFMGERYFAGYNADSKFVRSPVNLLTHGLLSNILIDENLNHTLTAGSALALSDGYAIWVENVNIDEALISLKINGEEIDKRSVKAGETYIYKKNIRRVKTLNGVHDESIAIGDLPIIAVKTDSILFKDYLHAITIKGIFQLSDSYTKIEADHGFGIYGGMGITNVSKTSISMANLDTINLRYPYSTEYELNSIGIVRNFGFKVADSEILRFLVERESWDYRNYQPRGAVYTESNPVLVWDGLNFAGFFYDLDSGNYSEILEITNISGRTIPPHGLKYTAFVTEIPYAVTKKTGIKPSGTNGSYKAIGFGAEKYAAIKGNSSRIAKVLTDNGTNTYEKKILLDGERWKLGDGYNLTIKSVDANSSPRRAKLTLSKNDIELDEKWTSQGSAYTYIRKNSSEENDLPLFVTYLHSVFNGETIPDLIELRYTWLLSDNITGITEGDRFGVFSVMKVEPDSIILENNRAINLTAGSCINLIGNLGFAVANSDELRFYPSGGKKCDQSG